MNLTQNLRPLIGKFTPRRQLQVGQLEKRRVRSELLSQYLVEPVEKSTLFYILEI